MGVDPITATLLAVTAVTSAKSISEQRKAGRAQEAAAAEQRKVFAAEQRRAEVQNVRSVRQQIREARMAQASMTNVAAQTGGMGGSGLAGGTASVESQMAGNLGYMSDIARENTAISNAQIASSGFMAQAARAQSRAAVYGQVGQLAGTIFSSTYKPTPSIQSPAPVRDANITRVG
jgi:hypothetical protein